jgi:hypothetical protein
MMNKDEALHKALKVLNCLNNDRIYETAWVKDAINACEEALATNEESLLVQPNALKMAGFELDGVIADIKLSGEFDCVSYDTVVRVRKTIADYVAQPQPKLFLDLTNSNGNHPVQQEHIHNCPNCNSLFTKEIYSTPAPSWQGLSDDEIGWLLAEGNGNYWDFARAIEQALKEKNA